ncbi:MAG: hypothetical protein QM786_19680 [Breznakibacter sp.]
MFTNKKWAYGLTSSGIIRVNEESGEINKFSKVNLLSDTDLSAFLPFGDDNDFFVGYGNGNIDIYQNGKLYNIPDIKEKTISGSKRINRFKLIGNYAYVATDFGVVVLDYLKKEIKDTWKLGEDNSNKGCYDVALHNDIFYVATASGLYKASAFSTVLSYFASWSLVFGNNKCAGVDIFDNKLIAIYVTGDASFVLKKLGDDGWEDITVYNEAFKNFFVSKNVLLIISGTAIRFLNNSLITYRTKSQDYFINEKKQVAYFSSAALPANGDHFWISDTSAGLLKELPSGVNEIFTPSGPLTNYCHDLAHSGTKLYVAPGIQTERWFKGNLSAQIYLYDGQWTNIAGSTNDSLKAYSDIYYVSLDPANTEHAMFSSWGNGVFEILKDSIVRTYNPTNSPIVSASRSDYNYTYCGGTFISNDGYTYIANTAQGILVKWQDEFYILNHKSFTEGWFGDLVMDGNGYLWTYVQRSDNGNGLLVLDTNGTPKDGSDDRYRGPQSLTADSDSKNYGQMELIDQDGNKVSAEFYSIAIDNNGYVWAGSDQGPFVNYRPWAVFSEDVPIFNRIKIPRNDGDNLADYLLESETITSITVDGANRKWFGTRNSGAFLVSEDGTETILSFNTSNSPLVSNTINSIAINPKNGDVFFATDKGIVSYRGNATEGLSTYSNVYAFPNPVRPEYKGMITVKGLMADSNVKITDVSGNLVYETKSLGGQAVWNGRNLWGKEVSSGVYLVFAASEQGQSSVVAKIMIVR